MNIKFRKTSRNDSGFTMIELMVSLLIAMILLGGVFQIFVKSSDGYRRLEGLAAVLDNGRFAMSFMQSTLQGAGYIGCRSSNVIINNNLNTPTNYAWNFAQPIIGYDDAGGGVWSPVLDASITTPLAGSDIITVRGAIGPPDVVTLVMGAPTSAVQISGANSFGPGTILLASNCNGNVDIFQKTDTAAGTAAHGTMAGFTPGNANSGLSTTFAPGANVVAIGTTTFYLRVSVNGVNSLYVIQGANLPLELVEGVDGMQILYGVTTNTDTSANQYLTANNVTDWTKVVSVRVALLLRTVNTVTRNPDINVYNLLGVNYPPGALAGNAIRYNDLRLRRIFTTTITLRNRSF